MDPWNASFQLKKTTQKLPQAARHQLHCTALLFYKLRRKLKLSGSDMFSPLGPLDDICALENILGPGEGDFMEVCSWWESEHLWQL